MASDPTGAVPVAYPPPPWHLGGTMHVSLWLVPVDRLPASLEAVRPADTRLATVAGQALVGTAFVRYAPGGVLTYDELLSAVLVRRGGRLRVTIPDIWVDEPASLAGGRELWGIPKRLARFERRPAGRGAEHLTAHADTGLLAEAHIRAGRPLPGWRRLPMPTAQRLDGVERDTPVQSLARVRLAAATWRFPDGSPLAYLAGRRPRLSVTLAPLSLTFGAAPA